MTDRITEPDFAKRYLLARYEAGGVVIDLDSGNYYRINRTAALVCDALLRARDPADAAAQVATELRIDGGEAAGLIEQVSAGLRAPVFRGEIQGSYHFYPNDSGYELRHGANRVLEIGADGSWLRLASPASDLAEPLLEAYVRALAPKLLFQQEISVLHASCCSAGGKLIAFAGVSRAGKTTTAHAFSAAGATLISEDLVLLPRDAAPMVLDGGEQRVRDWARAVTAQLLGHPDRAVPTAALAIEAVQGPTTRLNSILFVDASRREGSEFRSHPLADADALAELLRHDFLGASQPDSWRRFFQTAVALLSQIEARALWAPASVDLLPAAAARYISKTAS